MKQWIVWAGLLFLSAALPGDELAEAKKLEEKGSIEEAVQLYTRWIEGRKSLDSAAVQILLHTVDITSNIDLARKLLETSLSRIESREEKSRMRGLLGSFWERVGAFEPAQRSYQTAYEEFPEPSSFPFLLRSAYLLYELGEYEESEKQARVVGNLSTQPDEKWSALFHLARIFSVTERTSDALHVARRLLKEGEDAGREVQTVLFFLYSLTGSLGLKEEQETYKTRLSKESVLLTRLLNPKEKTQVQVLPLPSEFLGPGVSFVKSSSNSSSVRSTPSNESSPTPRAIQLGSFTLRENAEYLAKDIQALGFPAIVKQAKRKDGTTVFRTIVPLHTDPQTVLVQLKERGFEGFFLFETEEGAD